MGIEFAATDEDSGKVSPVENSCTEPMEVASAGSKRLSEPFFLKKILLEKSGDTSEMTTLATSVHAAMVESGFVLYNHGSDKFSFSKELFSVSLRYTLPQSDKQDSWSEVFMFWRMVKDGLVTPLLIGLCEKSGLELPPCLMRLPTKLKMKILESLQGASVAKMACVCKELMYVASHDDFWKQRCLDEAKLPVRYGCGDWVNWKAKFAVFWRHHRGALRNEHITAMLHRYWSSQPASLLPPGWEHGLGRAGFES
ncbi:unnamed protein product [Thlaspi arvense]|uniref:F-box domain-containing protein n=1 Tax=Thlaspi arvense TaxID=13288 RepID=A0AAU9SWC9_THLAR|nr:unnamed protein product [Thlaspi arvense]